MAARTKFLTPKTIIQLAVVVILLPMLPMLLSGLWDWWEAWAYVILSIAGFVVSRGLAVRRHPDLLEERSRSMELQDAKPWDKFLIAWSGAAVALLAGAAVWPPLIWVCGIAWWLYLTVVIVYTARAARARWPVWPPLLAAFVILATSPLWLNAGRVVPPPKPSLDTPAIQSLAGKEKQCVLPTEEMRAYHMQLLIDWRDQVVRTGNRVWVSPSGKKFEPSLTNTCLGCHSNKAEFCDSCHNYAAVTPNCWGCHGADGGGEPAASDRIPAAATGCRGGAAAVSCPGGADSRRLAGCLCRGMKRQQVCVHE